jgi:hypothetical protein
MAVLAAMAEQLLLLQLEQVVDLDEGAGGAGGTGH